VILFDRFVDITLIPESGAAEYIKTPETGMKPDIDISGSLSPAGVIPTLDIRIKNFYPARSLSEYKKLIVKAGYKQGLQSTFEGSIYTAYQESPGPDSTIYLQLVTANVKDWFNISINKYFPVGMPLQSVFADICKDLGIALAFSSTAAGLRCEAPIYETDLAMTSIQRICMTYGLVARADGDMLSIYPRYGYTDKVFDIEYVSSPPQKAGNGWILSAPWIPSLRHGDVVRINPRYFQATFGHAQIANQEMQKVLSLNFHFQTNRGDNVMNLQTQSTSEVLKEEGGS
jgi:hypothetical protein